MISPFLFCDLQMFIVNVKWKLLSFKLFIIKFLKKENLKTTNFRIYNILLVPLNMNTSYVLNWRIGNECCRAAHSSVQIQLKKNVFMWRC